MATDAGICSQALIMLGEQPIASLITSEGHEPTLICAATYPQIRDFYLATYPWRFALKRAQLTRDAAEPTGGGWLYSFQLPPDRAMWGGRQAFQSSGENEPPIRDWTILGNRLLANVSDVWLEYTWNVTEAGFPVYFAHFLAHALAASIAFAVTDQQNTAVYYQRVALGNDPSEAGGLLQQALIADAQAHPSTGFFHDDDLVVARFI
jgi:hypothetical protein